MKSSSAFIQKSHVGALCDKTLNFSPESLESFEYRPSPKALENASRAEQALIRLDERARIGKQTEALNSFLIDIDAVSSGRISGVKISIRDLFFQRLMRTLEQAHVSIPDFFELEYASSIPKEVGGYRSSLANLSTQAATLDSELLVNLYRSVSLEGVEGAFRNSELKLDGECLDSCNQYHPALPGEIEPLVDNLLSFCSQPYSTPLVQTALAHFRFESIYPFEHKMDFVGRLLSHAVLMKRGLEKNIVVPIGMYAALHVEEHAGCLFPYKSSQRVNQHYVNHAIDNFLDRCSISTEYAARIALVIMSEMQAMVKRWDTELGDVRADSGLKAILQVMLSTPIFNTEYLSIITGRSSTAINAAIKILTRCKIVKQVSSGKRNRLFEVPDVIKLFDWMENNLFPQNAPQRNDFLTNAAID